MALLNLFDDKLLTSFNRDVLLLNQNGQVEKKFTLPENLQPPDKPNNSDDEDDESNEKNKNKQQIGNKIQHLTLSPDHNTLAIATEEKLLHLYKFPQFELISTRPLSRTSSKIRFSPNSQQVLVADKTGDCFLFSCSMPENPAQWLLGHFSMVLDILFSPQQSHVITCDRDEKIRISNYPETSVIENYCLGHTEYVSSIELLPTNPDQVLLSISGDKTLKLWNYKEGEDLEEFKLPAAPLKMAVRKLNEDTDHIAITLIEHADVLIILEIVQSQDGYSCDTIGEYNFEGDVKDITGIVFNQANGDLLLSIVNSSNKISMTKLQYTNGTYDLSDDLQKCNKVLDDEFNAQPLELNNADEVGLLFKKKFNNIDEYQERKRRRIEEKNMKKIS